jgi:hypothetical protein
VQHLISEKPQNCGEISECTGSASVTKILNIPTKLLKRDLTEGQPGRVVKKYIEEARMDLKIEKSRLKKESKKNE